MHGNIRSNILWAFLAMAALDGILSGLLGNDTPSAGAREFALTLIELALVFAWVHHDSMERKFVRSALFNVGIAGAAAIFVPLYLYRSREPGQRSQALLGMLVFVAIALLLEIGMEWLARTLAL